MITRLRMVTNQKCDDNGRMELVYKEARWDDLMKTNLDFEMERALAAKNPGQTVPDKNGANDKFLVPILVDMELRTSSNLCQLVSDWSKVNFWMGKVTMYQYKLELESILQAHASQKAWIYKRNCRRICKYCLDSQNGLIVLADTSHLSKCPLINSVCQQSPNL
jgi:hypothetical protein